jgi:hypothetical protein
MRRIISLLIDEYWKVVQVSGYVILYFINQKSLIIILYSFLLLPVNRIRIQYPYSPPMRCNDDDILNWLDFQVVNVS